MKTYKEYESMGFNVWQMREICLGLEKGLDVSEYAKPEYDWMQMEEIRTKQREEFVKTL